MNYKLFVLSFIVYRLSFILAFSQPATIHGYAPDYKTKTVTVFTCSDFITNTPLKIASTVISDSGYFTLNIDNLKHCTYTYLNIDNLKGTIYIVPGNTYKVAFPPPDTNHYHNQFVQQVIDLDFIISDTTNINSLIIDFNEQFDKFWSNNYTYFVKKRAPPYLDSFYNAMQKRYSNINNPYFKGYMRYYIAELSINILEGRKTLGDKFIKDNPILYDNYQYMAFFNDYFKDYMSEFVYTREGSDIIKFINHPDVPDLMAVLKINRLLQNDSLCELVLLKGLYQFYYSGHYNPENIKILLRTIATTTHIEEDKTIANDMLASFSTINSGEDAPDFALKDSKGEVNSILDFRGKYLYLGFYKSSSSASQAEMEIIPALHKQYGKKIYFVFISEDDSYDEFQNFLKLNKTFNWIFLYDEGHRILAQYDVKTFPEYFLITPQGKFFISPADGPSHGIEQTFDEITSHKK